MERKNYYNPKHLITKKVGYNKIYNKVIEDNHYNDAKLRKIKVKNKKMRSIFNINKKYFVKLLFILCILPVFQEWVKKKIDMYVN